MSVLLVFDFCITLLIYLANVQVVGSCSMAQFKLLNPLSGLCASIRPRHHTSAMVWSSVNPYAKISPSGHSRVELHQAKNDGVEMLGCRALDVGRSAEVTQNKSLAAQCFASLES